MHEHLKKLEMPIKYLRKEKLKKIEKLSEQD